MSRLRIVYGRGGEHIARYEDGVLVWARGYEEPAKSALQIISDIEPYKAVAVDAATGEPPVITSRSRHREFLKRNGYEEVGNEKMPLRLPDPASKGLKDESAARYYDALHRRR